jgi:predicted permease
MFDIFGITLNILAPLFIIIVLSGIFGRIFNPDPRPISSLIIYVFVPSLVLRTLANSTVAPADVLAIGGSILLFTLAMVGVGYGAVRLFRIDPALTSAFLVSIVMVNAANYGIPLNSFAFGPEGEEIATIYYVLTVIIGNNAGIFLASNGRVGVGEAILNVLKVPVFSATVVGVLLSVFSIALPLPIDRAAQIMGSGAIPAMLAVLGMRLASIKLDTSLLRPIVLASGLRLIAAPLMVAPIALLLGLDGLAFNVTVVQTATPTAVLAAAVALEFGDHSEFVSAVTLVSTIASILTMTVLLAIIGVA